MTIQIINMQLQHPPNFNLDSTLTSFKVDQERENGTLTYIIARNKYDAYRHWDADFTSWI